MTTFERRRLVTGRIRRLTDGSASSGAQLAALRRGLGKAPGSVPEIWGLTLEGLPEDLRGGAREREELAIHLALTHFAFHQQSKKASMHNPDVRFGQAVRSLAVIQMTSEKDPHQTPAYRRFTTLAAARGLTAATTHLRGLIGQMRANDISFDYGRFVDDLYWLQVPSTAVTVQRAWGRDFHHLNKPEQATEGES